MLGDDELALVINQFKRFHDNRKNRHRGGQNEGYFNCGDPDHFIANCPKMKGKYDFSKHKEKREHTSDKHKSREEDVRQEGAQEVVLQDYQSSRTSLVGLP